MTTSTMKPIREATPITYEGGIISIRPGQPAVRKDEMVHIFGDDLTNYRLIESGLRGWGRAQVIVLDCNGFHYLARLAR